MINLILQMNIMIIDEIGITYIDKHIFMENITERGTWCNKECIETCRFLFNINFKVLKIFFQL